MVIAEFKRRQLEDVARHRDALRKNPRLAWLFFEITSRCNLNCKHCGSSCGKEGSQLSIQDILATLDTVKGRKPIVCLTGGEPMLHPNFFEIAEAVRQAGFVFSMTTNATLIDDEAAMRLRRAGMATVSVSLDGLEESHDALRQRKGAFRLALRGIEALQRAGFQPQVTSVIHSGNTGELKSLYSLLSEMGITSWRPINVEPIGRACESGNLMLSHSQLAELLSFIREKRFDSGCKTEVTFGCSHYLGVEWERMVRDHYFLCGAGILTASVRCNGDICACLDIENRPELVQGNIRRDSFFEVWQNRFEAFRADRTSACQKCIDCLERFVCGGDSAHTWNYASDEPNLCYRDYATALGDLNSFDT